MIELTLTLKMTIAQDVETSVTVNNNNPIQDYADPDDHTQPTHEMTPGLKPFTIFCIVSLEEVAHELDDISSNRLKCADIPGILFPFNYNV